jgi:hypothetical protein
MVVSISQTMKTSELKRNPQTAYARHIERAISVRVKVLTLLVTGGGDAKSM